MQSMNRVSEESTSHTFGVQDKGNAFPWDIYQTTQWCQISKF